MSPLEFLRDCVVAVADGTGQQESWSKRTAGAGLAPTVSLLSVTRLEQLTLSLGLLALRLLLGLLLVCFVIGLALVGFSSLVPCNGCFATVASALLASLAAGVTLALLAPLAAAVRATVWGISSGSLAALIFYFADVFPLREAQYVVLGLTLVVFSIGAQTSSAPEQQVPGSRASVGSQLLNLAALSGAVVALLRGVYLVSQLLPAQSSQGATAIVAAAIASIGVLAAIGQQMLWGVRPGVDQVGRPQPPSFPTASAAGLLAWVGVLALGFGVLDLVRKTHALDSLGDNPDAAVLAGVVIAMTHQLLSVAMSWALRGRRVRPLAHAIVLAGIWVNFAPRFPNFLQSGPKHSYLGVALGLIVGAGMAAASAARRAPSNGTPAK
jgi:hypothetical protein